MAEVVYLFGHDLHYQNYLLLLSSSLLYLLSY